MYSVRLAHSRVRVRGVEVMRCMVRAEVGGKSTDGRTTFQFVIQ